MKKPTGHAAANERNFHYAKELELRLASLHSSLNSLAKVGPSPEVRLFAAITARIADLTQPFTPQEPTKKGQTP